MVYYKPGYEYDDKIRSLETKIFDLEKKSKYHTDLKSREMFVRRQEQSLLNLKQEIIRGDNFNNLKKIMKKHDHLWRQWNNLLVLTKLMCDPDELEILNKIINDNGEDFV